MLELSGRDLVPVQLYILTLCMFSIKEWDKCLICASLSPNCLIFCLTEVFPEGTKKWWTRRGHACCCNVLWRMKLLSVSYNICLCLYFACIFSNSFKVVLIFQSCFNFYVFGCVVCICSVFSKCCTCVVNLMKIFFLNCSSFSLVGRHSSGYQNVCSVQYIITHKCFCCILFINITNTFIVGISIPPISILY